MLAIPSQSLTAAEARSSKERMHVLLVFYSRTGNTKKVAELIGKELNCEKEEIIDTDKREGALGLMRSVYQTIIKQKAEIKPTAADPGKYDLVIIGTPAWGGSVSAPVRTYITNNAASFTKVAFFSTMGASGGDGANKEMGMIIGKDPIAVLTVSHDDLSKGTYTEKTAKFIDEIKNSLKR